MDWDGFVEFLAARQLTAGEIEQSVAVVETFARQLKALKPPLSLEQASPQAAHDFIGRLIATQQNTELNLAALARAGYFAGNSALYVTVLALLDGSEVMGELHSRLGASLGERARDEIFDGIELPPLGTPSEEKARLMRIVIDRLEQTADPEACKQLLCSCLRHLDDDWFAEHKRQYQQCADIDQYLALRSRELVKQLEAIRSEGGLFFNQPITDEVIEYVRADPEIESGTRRGDTVFVSKIPYLAAEYLAATDDDEKRYLYCHCPWARESLRDGSPPVSATFCYCSGGFSKRSLEVVLGQQLEVEVIESVLKGDLRCRFAIKLPPGVIPADD